MCTNPAQSLPEPCTSSAQNARRAARRKAATTKCTKCRTYIEMHFVHFADLRDMDRPTRGTSAALEPLFSRPPAFAVPHVWDAR